jgi:DNA polymerase
LRELTVTSTATHGRGVGAEAHLDWHAAAASALAWWHEAGVDTLVGDEARDWLAPPVVAPPPIATPLASALPTTLQSYLAWRHVGEVPEAAWPGGWIAASGPGDARLMVLVDCPDRDDGDELLSGAAGRLFDRMLAAIGLTRDRVHLASVCAKRPTAGRLPAEATERLHELARHHVGLLAPQRLLVLGNAASRAVLATDVAPARGRLHPLNHDTTTTTQVVASFHPRFLLEKPAAKAGAWADLQRLRRNLEI